MPLLSQCMFCESFQGHKGTKPLCDAFPLGIPDSVYDNEFDHQQPYPGDNGLRYVQTDELSQFLGKINMSNMAEILLPNWQRVQQLFPTIVEEEKEVREANSYAEERIQRTGRQFKRGALTRREYQIRVLAVLNELDRMLGWRYVSEFSQNEMFRLDICLGCQAELRWDRHYAYSYVSSNFSDIICCSLDIKNCLRCGSLICEERLIAYKPDCEICGREAGPGKRGRNQIINEDSPRSWKCNECSLVYNET